MIHFMFTDDLTIFVKAIVEVTREVKVCLDKVCSWSSQTINFQKSMLHYSKNVGAELKNEIGEIL